MLGRGYAERAREQRVLSSITGEAGANPVLTRNRDAASFLSDEPGYPGGL